MANRSPYDVFRENRDNREDRQNYANARSWQRWEESFKLMQGVRCDGIKKRIGNGSDTYLIFDPVVLKELWTSEFIKDAISSADAVFFAKMVEVHTAEIKSIGIYHPDGNAPYCHANAYTSWEDLIREFHNTRSSVIRQVDGAIVKIDFADDAVTTYLKNLIPLNPESVLIAEDLPGNDPRQLIDTIFSEIQEYKDHMGDIGQEYVVRVWIEPCDSPEAKPFIKGTETFDTAFNAFLKDACDHEMARRRISHTSEVVLSITKKPQEKTEPEVSPVSNDVPTEAQDGSITDFIESGTADLGPQDPKNDNIPSGETKVDTKPEPELNPLEKAVIDIITREPKVKCRKISERLSRKGYGAVKHIETAIRKMFEAGKLPDNWKGRPTSYTY